MKIISQFFFVDFYYIFEKVTVASILERRVVSLRLKRMEKWFKNASVI